MKKNIQLLKISLQRLSDAIEFRILLAVFSLAVFIFPFMRYTGLENSWTVYLSVFAFWLGLIFVLFLLSLQKDVDENEDLE